MASEASGPGRCPRIAVCMGTETAHRTPASRTGTATRTKSPASSLLLERKFSENSRSL